ncbi:hypothetical protein SAMN05216420_102191 [Nitrosospira sp. Nl5]|uniref:hypothetical protein n=1 Tax=Nitrosospira sp. Nl5 TaxID=200120 RepID=UPI0008851AA1|nr:hypothetical protein [Nitrosospira sp. Nl5]SCY07087.1 hypothetical protein SAMN05216420_102191 [Nitrosospira sp. Nl5]
MLASPISANLSVRLPPANAVASMLGELIGRAVTAKVVPAKPMVPGTQAVGAYFGECESLRVVVCCDLAVGGSLGAALVMVPAARVDECVKEKCLDEILTENLYEVFNVLAAVFPQNGAPRVIFRSLYCANVPGEVKAVLAKPLGRLDLEIDIAGYRSGRLAILAAGRT